MNTDVLKIREASIEDAGPIASLLTELGYPASAAAIPGRLAAVTGTPGRVLIAERDGAVLGVVSVTRLNLFHRSEPVALLSALVVRAEHRGEGVGGALVEAAARQATVWGCGALELTSRDDRDAAHRFYVSLGFESGSRKFARPVRG
jgi:GNAT superfamily N-acetyltransferase